MKKLILALFITASISTIVQAGIFYDSPSYSTATNKANMGLVGNFHFYKSTSDKTYETVIGSTQGIIASTVSATNIILATTTLKSRIDNLDLSTKSLTEGNATSYIRSDGTFLSGQSFKVSSGTLSDKLTVGSTLYVDTMDENTVGNGVLINNHLQYSNGILGQPIYIDNADGTITVGITTAIIQNNADYLGGCKLIHVATRTLSLTQNSLNYVVINWNSGSPQYEIAADRNLITQSDIIPVFRIYAKNNTVEYIMNYGIVGLGNIPKNNDRLIRLRGIEKEDGLVLTSTSNSSVVVSEGHAWFGLKRYTSDSFFSTSPATCKMELVSYNNGSWGSYSTTTYPTDIYQGTAGTTTLTSNRYAIIWVWKNILDCEVDFQLGTGDYTLAQAIASLIPSNRPTFLTGFYVPIGRIIIQKGQTVPYSVEAYDAKSGALVSAGITSHPNLTELAYPQSGHTGFISTTTFNLFKSSFEITSANISSLTVIGTITSTNGFVGGKSTITVGGIVTDKITFADGTYFTSATFSGGGSGTTYVSSTHPFLTYVVISSVATDNDKIYISAKLRLGSSALNFTTVCALNITGIGGAESAEQASTLYNLWLGYKSGTFSVLASAYANDVPTTDGYYWIKVGQIYNDGTSNITKINSNGGKKYTLNTHLQLFSGDPLSTYSDIDLNGILPPNTSRAYFHVTVGSNGGDIGGIHLKFKNQIAIAEGGADDSSKILIYAVGTTGDYVSQNVDLSPIDSLILQFQETNSDTDFLYIQLLGYEVQ